MSRFERESITTSKTKPKNVHMHFSLDALVPAVPCDYASKSGDVPILCFEEYADALTFSLGKETMSLIVACSFLKPRSAPPSVNKVDYRM